MPRRKPKSKKEVKEKHKELVNNNIDEEKVKEVFEQLEEASKLTTKIENKRMSKAIKTYKELICDNTIELDIDGVKFVMKRNIPAVDYYESAGSDDHKDWLKLVHSLIIEPEMSFDEFLQMSAHVVKYLEMVVNQHFLTDFSRVASNNSLEVA